MTTTIFFTSSEHRTRWLTTLLITGAVDAGRIDPEYGSALYLLTSREGTWQKAQGYISHHRVLIENLIAEVDFSAAYLQLIKLAGNLFNGTIHVDPVEFYRLDEENFTLALNALQIRRASFLVSEVASEAELSAIARTLRSRIVADNRPKPQLPIQPGEEEEGG
jgi:hypothetical protein